MHDFGDRAAMKRNIMTGAGFAACLMTAMTVAGCAGFGNPEQGIACDGQKTWCLTVGNEVRHDVRVYLDGLLAGTAPAQGSVVVPLTPGETHQVNYCRDWSKGLFSESKVVCSKPAALTADGNQVKVIYDAYFPGDR